MSLSDAASLMLLFSTTGMLMRSKLSYHTTSLTSQLHILDLVSKAHLSYIITFSFVTDKQPRVLSQGESKKDAWTVR